MATSRKSKVKNVEPVVARVQIVGGDHRGRGFSITFPAKVFGSHGWEFGTPYKAAVRGKSLVLTREESCSEENLSVRLATSKSSHYLPLPEKHLEKLQWPAKTLVVLSILPGSITISIPSASDILKDQLVETWLSALFAMGFNEQDAKAQLQKVTGIPISVITFWRWRTGIRDLPGIVASVMTQDVLKVLLSEGPIQPKITERLCRALSLPKNAKQSEEARDI